MSISWKSKPDPRGVTVWEKMRAIFLHFISFNSLLVMQLDVSLKYQNGNLLLQYPLVSKTQISP